MEIKQIRYYCEHNRSKYYCKDCGGNGICEHNKRKSKCKVCGGSEYCVHNKQKSYCKDCGGSQICEHNKIKSRCKDCGGNGICEHNKRKAYCKDCGGSQICEHNKIKSFCKDCGGNGICEHNKLKCYCKDCGGSAYCVHNKQKSCCKDCKGSQICEHNKQKSCCKDCKGSQICEHNTQKQHCRLCGGNAYCKHDKQKIYCITCDGKALCKTELCETKGIPKYNGYCLPCCIQVHPEITVSRNYKTKEKDVVDRVMQKYPHFSWVHDKRIQDGCSLRRPDLLLDMGSHIIIIEIDENKHTDYDCSCENKRLMQISLDLHHRPIVFIRFNPDSYTNDQGVLVKSCWKLNKMGIMTVMKTKQTEWEERIETLKQQIQYWIDNPTSKTIEIIELFY
jgi:hypothetical protein